MSKILERKREQCRREREMNRIEQMRTDCKEARSFNIMIMSTIHYIFYSYVFMIVSSCQIAVFDSFLRLICLFYIILLSLYLIFDCLLRVDSFFSFHPPSLCSIIGICCLLHFCPLSSLHSMIDTRLLNRLNWYTTFFLFPLFDDWY